MSSLLISSVVNRGHQFRKEQLNVPMSPAQYGSSNHPCVALCRWGNIRRKKSPVMISWCNNFIKKFPQRNNFIRKKEMFTVQKISMVTFEKRQDRHIGGSRNGLLISHDSTLQNWENSTLWLISRMCPDLLSLEPASVQRLDFPGLLLDFSGLGKSIV